MSYHDIHFAQPDANVMIWRYMNVVKFFSLLSKGLFFCQVDNLDDPYESSLEWLIQVPENSDVRLIDSLKSSYIKRRKRLAVSCWHISPYESAALWSQYSGTDAGIAIRSSVKRLEESLKPNLSPSQKLFIGPVNYVERGGLKIPEDGSQPTDEIDFTFYKRKSFEHERELRLLLEYDDQGAGGFYVTVDPNRLIESVLVSPLSHSWVLDVVQCVASKFSLPKEIIVQSDLNTSPLY